MIVYNYDALTNSTDVTKLFVYDFSIAMETTGGDASCLNGNNELCNRSIHNMVREGLLDSNQYEINGVVKSIDSNYTLH